MAQKNRPQAETLSGLPQPNFTGFAPKAIIAKRNPTSGDTGYQLGQEWVNKENGNSFQLTQVSAGSANWVNTGVDPSGNVDTLTGDTGGPISPSAGNINIVGGNTVTVSGSGHTLTIDASTGSYPITPYVVGPSGQAGYQTIQAAVSAAGSAGGGIVYVQPGTYTENVTMGVGVHLVGLVGTSGNMILTDDGGEVPPVEIIGNFTVDVTAAQVVPTTEIHNVMITATSGNVFTYVGTPNLLESGYLTFFNCYLQTGTGSTALFYIDGFMNINFESCVITEASPDTTTFANFGAIYYINFSCRDSVISINRVNAWMLPNDSFITWAVENSFYTIRTDLTTGVSSLSFNSTNSFLDYQGGSSGDALIEFAGNDGSVVLQNCVIGTSSGSPANSTTSDANSVFRYTACVFNNPLVLGATGRGDFSFCKIYGGTDPSVTMSSAQNVSFESCIFSSTNNPSITGAGAGTITLTDISFIGNSSISGSLTTAWGPTKTGSFTVTGDVTTSGGTVSINSGTNALGISTDASATTVSLATGAAAKTVTLGSTNTTSTTTVACGTGGANFGTSANAHTTTVGSTTSTSATTVQSGSGNLNVTSTNGAMTLASGTGALSISADAAATTVNVGTGAGAKIVTLGSTNSTSATTIQSGSGALNITSTNGAQTHNSGTGAFGISTDAAATTISIGTGAGAKAITIGSTNTTSATNLTAGSGGVNCATDFALTTVATKISLNGGAVTDFIGTATLTNGTVTVANTNIAATDRILVTRSAKNASTAYGTFEVVKTASTNFVITSCKADTTTETGDQSTVDYIIFRQT